MSKPKAQAPRPKTQARLRVPAVPKVPDVPDVPDVRVVRSVSVVHDVRGVYGVFANARFPIRNETAGLSSSRFQIPDHRIWNLESGILESRDSKPRAFQLVSAFHFVSVFHAVS